MAFITIDRKLFDHFLWTERRPFSKFEAWIDLIQLVSFREKNSKLISGALVTWGRGQFPVSYSFLAERWSWSTNRVRGYMRLLKNNNQITTESTSVITILTLCNYEQYNTNRQAEGQAPGQAEGQEVGQADHKRTAGSKIKKQDKEGKQEETGIKIPAPPEQDFIDMIIQEWKGEYLFQRQIEYVIVAPGKERAAAGKLLREFSKKFPDDNSETILGRIRDYFSLCIAINDNWLWQNMSLPVLISKFNEINTALKNEKHKRNNNRASDGSTTGDIIRDQAGKLGIELYK